MKIGWHTLHFNNLTNYQLYQIIQLRNEVFVVEQNCVFQDVDGLDVNAYHILGFNDNNILVAYARILAPAAVYKEPSIGRVVVKFNYRKFGGGKQLMHKAIEQTIALYGKQPIKIGAQCYLNKFYKDLGFTVAGNEYLEDGIPHQPMLWQP
jgi:ElaA protein